MHASPAFEAVLFLSENAMQSLPLITDSKSKASSEPHNSSAF